MSFAVYGEAKDMQLATTQGGGIGLNITEVILMNFTNSPYERIMKEVPRYKKPALQKAPKGSLCAKVFLLAWYHLHFLLLKVSQRAGPYVSICS